MSESTLPQIDVHHPTANLGLSRWETTISETSRFWRESTARIQRLTDAAPWGRDSAGATFESAFVQKDSAGNGDSIIRGLEILGWKVRQAVTTTDETDLFQARMIQSI